MTKSTPCHSVFLVGGHPVVLLGIRAMAEAQADLRVAGVAGDLGSALISVAKTVPDIVVVDASLPMAGRIILVERMRALYPRIPVLVLTSLEEAAFTRQLLQAGAQGFILSCSAAEELIHAIRSVLDGGLYLDPGMAAQILIETRTPVANAELLSNSEAMIVKLVAKGFSNKEISSQLSLSVKTVETYRARATDKLGLRTRSAIVRYATTEGWMMHD